MAYGYDKRDGYVNVDVSAVCEPDFVCDLESLSWPWDDDSVDQVVFNHSLEQRRCDIRSMISGEQPRRLASSRRFGQNRPFASVQPPKPAMLDHDGSEVAPLDKPGLSAAIDSRSPLEWCRLGRNTVGPSGNWYRCSTR